MISSERNFQRLVQMNPGATMFMRIPLGARSTAKDFIMESIAPFEATYVIRLRLTRSEEFEPTKTTTPRCPVAGLGSCRMKNLFAAS